MRRSDRRRRRIVAGVVCLLLVVLGFGIFQWSQSAAQQRNLDQARAAGLEAYRAGDYEASLPSFSYVASRDPTDVEVLMAFGDARSKIPLENDRHLFEAIGLYMAALHQEPRNLTALERLLVLYEQTGRRLEWIEMADRVLAIDPNHIDALRLQATGYAIVSEYEKASTYTSRLMEIEPAELEWRIFHLQIERDREKPASEIRAMCDRWIDEAPGDARDGRFHMLKASFLANIGERDEARETALEAASPSLGAGTQDVLQRMVSLLDALQLQSEATELIERTKTQFPNKQWPHETAVRRLWQAGRTADALEEIEQVRQSHGEIGRGLMRWKSLLLLDAYDLDGARAVLAELEESLATDDVSPMDALARDADRAWIEAVRARIELDNLNWSQALATYRSAIALDPNDSVLHFLLGEAYMLVGEYELASASLERAVRSDPNWIASQSLYIESLMRIGRTETAARVAVGLLRRVEQPTLNLYILFARAWLASGMSGTDLGVLGRGGRSIDPQEFLRVLRQYAPEDSPENAEVIKMLVSKLLDDGEAESAGEVIEEILANERVNPDALVDVARQSAVAQLGFEERLLDRAIQRVGMTLEIAEVQARILHRNGRTAEGRALLEEFLAQEPLGTPEYDMAQRVLASYLVLTRDPDARNVLRSILADAEGKPDAITFVLAQPLTWVHAELADKAVGLLAEALGEASLRVSLAEATYVLHFERERPASMARALMTVNDVLQRTPDSLGALTLMSALHLASNPPDTEAAIRQLQRALRAHPRRADLYPQLIALLQQQGDMNTAETYLTRFTEMAGRSEGLRNAEMRLLEAQGDFQSIISLLSERLASSGSEIDRAMLLSAYHRAGRQEHAKQIATSLLEIPEPAPQTLAVLARYYADIGRAAEGLRLLSEFEEREPAEGALLLGAYRQYIGHPDEAEQALLRAVQLMPREARAWHKLADHYMTLGEYREARQAAQSGLAVSPQHQGLRTTLVLASLTLGGGARHEAIALLETMGESHKSLAATLRVYSNIAGRADGVPTSRDLSDASRLVREHPNYLPGWRLAIAAHAQVGQLESAADLATRAAIRFPNEAEPAKQATQLLIQLGRLRDAVDMARTWRGRSHGRVLVPDVVIASLLLERGQPKAALQQIAPHAQRIVSEREDRPDHMHALLRTMIANGEVDRALESVRPLHEAGEAIWMTVLLSTAGNAAPADGARLLVELEPYFANDAQGRVAMASEWLRVGVASQNESHLERAARLAEEAAERDASQTPRARLILGAVAEFRGDLETAESYYRQVIASEPRNAIALNNLAHVLVRRGRHYDEAVALSERALAILPDHPDLLETHAEAMLWAGQAKAAEPHARRALEQRPNDVVALLTLTQILLAQNRVEEAHATYLRAEEVLSTLPRVNTHVRSKHNEVERAILSAHLTSESRTPHINQ